MSRRALRLWPSLLVVAACCAITMGYFVEGELLAGILTTAVVVIAVNEWRLVLRSKAALQDWSPARVRAAVEEYARHRFDAADILQRADPRLRRTEALELAMDAFP